MDYQGKIYRPWPEANSMLIQTTLGCTHNKCTFCDMFREKRFSIRKIEEIFQDINEARQTYPHIRSIFLIDGNVLALKTAFLLGVLGKITSTFPECSKISLYAGLNDLRRKTVEELTELKQAVEGMAKAKAAGIEVLVSIIFGIGGRKRTREHAVETTKLLNLMEPEELAPMALAVQPGTELAHRIETGKFIQAAPLQILEEEKHLLENLAAFDTMYWGDHANNIVSSRGRMPASRELFLKKIDHAIANHPVTELEVLITSPW